MRNFLIALLTLGLTDLGVSADGSMVGHNLQKNLQSLKYNTDFSQVDKMKKLGNEEMAEVKVGMYRGKEKNENEIEKLEEKVKEMKEL